ncbi:hypothetical protein [Actinopolymorpha pittospori]|uniref:Uncharacterized protein n=1 Tax=Actinopolymorpha pittospori TaxID=648752 RepID=A0A927RLD8_9ACTN|nr:hypothetical protein [Actinopolymorpha pittospori]MBE1609106.1 hypothetical protein [Actinopolymorpha pittospori]
MADLIPDFGRGVLTKSGRGHQNRENVMTPDTLYPLVRVPDPG